MKSKLKPLPHQSEGIRRARYEPFLALFMEQGTGKTLTAIKIMEEAFKRGEIERLIIYCPNTLTYNWLVELQSILEVPHKILRFDKKTGAKGNREEITTEFLSSDLRYYTLNQLREMGYKGRKCDIVNQQERILRIIIINWEKTGKMMNELKKFKSDSFIVDECHKLKNHNAQRSKNVFAITRGAVKGLILSGTPIGKGKWDLFMQLRILKPTILGSWKQFSNDFIVKGGFMGKEIVGIKHERQLDKLVSQYSYVVKSDMKDPEFIYVSCVMPSKARKMYKQLDSEMIAELDRLPEDVSRKQIKTLLKKNAIRYRARDSYYNLWMKALPYIKESTSELALTKHLRMQQLSGGFLTLDSGKVEKVHDSKIQALVECLSDHKTDNPVIVFCAYIAEIDAICDVLKDKYRVANWRDTKNRDKIYQDFRNGKYDIIVMQITSGSLGLNLQNADLEIFYSITFLGDEYAQAIARIRRLGQKNSTKVVHLVNEDTHDMDIINVVGERMALNTNFLSSIDNSSDGAYNETIKSTGRRKRNGTCKTHTQQSGIRSGKEIGPNHNSKKRKARKKS